MASCIEDATIEKGMPTSSSVSPTKMYDVTSSSPTKSTMPHHHHPLRNVRCHVIIIPTKCTMPHHHHPLRNVRCHVTTKCTMPRHHHPLRNVRCHITIIPYEMYSLPLAAHSLPCPHQQPRPCLQPAAPASCLLPRPRHSQQSPETNMRVTSEQGAVGALASQSGKSYRPPSRR